MGLLACLATSNFKRSLGKMVYLLGSFRSSALVMRTSADSWQPEGAGLEICCSASLPMAVLAQRHREWGCLLVLPPQTSNVTWEWGGACQTPLAALLRTCERLQRAGSQKGLPWKALAQPHLPMALLAESHRVELLACLANSNFKRSLGMGGCLPGSFHSRAPKIRMSADRWQPEGASLQSCCSASSANDTARTEPQRLELLASLATSNFKRSLGIGGACQTPLAALLQRCERLQIAGSQKGLAWKAVAQPHLPMALLE